MATDASSIPEILHRPSSDKDTRLFLGRAQWTVDQLHSEIMRGAWTLAPATPDVVFSPDPARVWQDLVQQAKLRQIEEDLGSTEQPLGFSTLRPE